MARTNVDIDNRACAEVMRRYNLETKREAINFALRTVAAEPTSVDEARSLRGTGWGRRPRRDAFQPRSVILVDTSAWIEFLRDTGSPVCSLVDELLAGEIAICDAVRMEVLAGGEGRIASAEPSAAAGAGDRLADTGDRLRGCRRPLSPLPAARGTRSQVDRLPDRLSCRTRRRVHSAQRRRLQGARSPHGAASS